MKTSVIVPLVLAIILQLIPGNISSAEIDLKAFVKRYDNVLHRNGEVETGCMCPSEVDTKGIYQYFCGNELKPYNSTGKCVPQGIFRCINGRKVAIQEVDCGKSAKTCVPSPLNDGQYCEDCILYHHKQCKK